MNCAQTVLSVFCGDYGMDRIIALRLARGFGVGMGRAGNTCGVVSGACMVLGLAQVAFEENPRASVERTCELVTTFNSEFVARRGSLLCRDLIGYDLGTPEGLAAARENKVFTGVCPSLVAEAAGLVETLLAQSQ
jgi:C_GCAxxG_C_C family probable redox protein